MAKTVAHFIRKDTQLKASFIQNQIVSHINYQSYVIFRQKQKGVLNDGGFAADIQDKVDVFDLAKNEGFKEKLLFKYTKQLSKKQKKILRNKVKELQPDMLHFHYGTDAGIYLKALKNVDIPKVVSFYGYDCYSFPQKVWGLARFYLKKRVFRFASVVLAMSQEMKNDLILTGCPAEKIVVHYHGVPSTLQKIQVNYKIVDIPRLLMVSYLDPVKGHKFVLEALNILKNNGYTDFYLDIVGGGFFENEVRQCVEKYELLDYVYFSGSIAYMSQAFIDKFQNSSIFLHPSVKTESDKEGIPGSLVEAMFAGLPVISTFHGGIPYVLTNNKTGILVHEWDVNNLAKAIKTLVESERLRKRLGTAARKYAKENLELSKRQSKLEGIYFNLLNE